MQYQLMFKLVQTVQRLWNQAISSQGKIQVLMLWTLLWVGVVRPIGKSCKANDVISCNRVAFQDVETKPISRHHFEIQKEVKDAGISDIMERTYQLDFMEPKTELKDLMTNRLEKIRLLKLGNIMKPLYH